VKGYAVASRRGGVEDLRPATKRWFPTLPGAWVRGPPARIHAGAAPAHPRLPGEGGGETWFPQTPAQAAIRCHEGDGPPPQPSPRWGEGVRRLSPAGGGWEGGLGRRMR